MNGIMSSQGERENWLPRRSKKIVMLNLCQHPSRTTDRGEMDPEDICGLALAVVRQAHHERMW
jgi:hypothetical protein